MVATGDWHFTTRRSLLGPNLRKGIPFKKFTPIKNKHATTHERRRTSNGTPLTRESLHERLAWSLSKQNLQPQPSLLY
jgi:hypothetical protein